MSGLTRRQLLFGGLGLTVAGVGLHQGATTLRRAAALTSISWISTRPEELMRLGELYLELHPEEASTRRLSGLVFPDLGPFAWQIDPETARSSFARQVQRDFETGEIVVIDGWRLSRTEARLGALLLLHEGSS